MIKKKKKKLKDVNSKTQNIYLKKKNYLQAKQPTRPSKIAD